MGTHIIITLVLTALTAAVVLILVCAELVRVLATSIECVASHRALTTVCL
jgi:hypothetical protein